MDKKRIKEKRVTPFGGIIFNFSLNKIGKESGENAIKSGNKVEYFEKRKKRKTIQLKEIVKR